MLTHIPPPCTVDHLVLQALAQAHASLTTTLHRPPAPRHPFLIPLGAFLTSLAVIGGFVATA